MNEIGKWQPVACPMCGRNAYARQHDYSTKHVEHLYVEVAPHWDWLNRTCLIVNSMRRGIVAFWREPVWP